MRPRVDSTKFATPASFSFPQSFLYVRGHSLSPDRLPTGAFSSSFTPSPRRSYLLKFYSSAQLTLSQPRRPRLQSVWYVLQEEGQYKCRELRSVFGGLDERVTRDDIFAASDNKVHVYHLCLARFNRI